MKRRLLISPIVLLSVLFFVTSMISCSSDGADGVNGIDGIDGAQGPAGPAGPVGSEGPQGGTGSGNIIYSEWMDVAFAADTIHTGGGGVDTIGYYANVNVPQLDLEMLNTADVKMYINTNNADDPVIYPLPYNSSNGIYIQMSSYTGAIQLYSNINVGTVIDNSGVKYQQYRYMIVPGNVGATASRTSVNWSDYNEAKNHLGLKD